MQLRQSATYLLLIISLTVSITGCSSGRNTSGSRAYHKLNSRYNSFHNAQKIYEETYTRQLNELDENWFELLPFYPVTYDSEKTQPGGPYDIVVDKLVKNIQNHSITAKPRRNPSKAHSTEYRQWLRQNEFNPFMKNVWLLLGKAHTLNGDFDIALSVFSEIAHIFPEDLNLISESQIWMMRIYTETDRFYDADNITYILQSRQLKPKLKNLFTEGYTYLLLQKKRYSEAIPYLIECIANEPEYIQRKRLQFILGQTYTLVGEKSKAKKTFDDVRGLRTPFELSRYASVYQDSTFNITERTATPSDTLRYDTEFTPIESDYITRILSHTSPQAEEKPFFARSSLQRLSNIEEALSFEFNESAPHNIIILQHGEEDEINELLFATANFNFSRFNLRTFKLSPIRLSNKRLLKIESFYSYNDALKYLHLMEGDSLFRTAIPADITPIIITEENLSMVYSLNTLEEYLQFHTELTGYEYVLESYYSEKPEESDTEPAEKPENDIQIETEDIQVRTEAAATATKTDPTELKRELEQKAEQALKRSEQEPTAKSRRQLLKERERQREERIKQREQELKERQQRREAEIKQRELNRKQR